MSNLLATLLVFSKDSFCDLHKRSVKQPDLLCFFLFPVYVSEWLIHDNYYNCPTVNYKNLPVIYLFLLIIGKQYLFQCCQGCSGSFDILSILSCFFHCRQNLQIILLPSDKFSQIYSRLILMYFFRSHSVLGFSFCQDYGT